MIRVLAKRAEFTSGDTVTLEAAMTRDGSRFFPADAYNLLFTAKLSRDDTDEEAVIQKYTGVGITVTNDKAYVELVNVDTEEQQDVMLFCDIRAINIETGDRHKVADWELTLNKPVTQGTVPSVPIHTTNPAEFNGDLTSGPVTSSGGVSAIADGAITDEMLANSAVANLSGTNTGDQTTITGNAGTATALQTARTINGVSFDGTANITVTAAAGTLTGTTLASNVTASSLTSVGTVATGTWNASVISGQYGGTGVNNSGKTITLGASLITTGTDIPTFAFPSSATARTYTFPATSATLARTDSAQDFWGNQKITGALQVNETSGTAITANSLLGNQANFGGGKFLIQNNGIITSNVIGGLPFASQVELTSQSLLTGNSAVTRALGDARYLQPTVATKTTPVDADTVELQDSVASGARKLLSFENLLLWAKAELAPGLTVVVSDESTTESAAFTAIPDNWKYDVFNTEPATLVIGEGVTHIGNLAFSRDLSAYGLAGSLTIPDSVITIGSSAFFYCTSLTSLTLGDSVASIGSSAFRSCSGLAGSLTIPDSVTTIGNYAFHYCSGLTSLTLGDSVTTIGSGAFQYCSGLTGSLTIPDSVTSIGNYAFLGCSGLTSLTLGDSVTSIGDSAFYNCSGLTGLILGDSVTTIGSHAFYNCFGLTSLTLGDSVTSIGDSAFYNCSGLTSLTIPNSVTSIGSSAFNYCSGLTNVNCHVTRSTMNAANCLNGTSVTTLHARASDGTWTAGADTIGGKALTVIKDL